MKKNIKQKKFLIPIIFFILLLSVFAIIAIKVVIWQKTNDRNEKIIDQVFHADIAQYPNVKVTRFMLWEGDSMVTLDIPGKSPVSFWYGIDKVPRIEGIGTYNTQFDCFKVNSSGKKINYAATTDLWLDSTSPFHQWFPFYVNTIGDLLNKYDDIVKILDTFPKNQPLIQFKDGNGARTILQVPNLNYEINLNGNKNTVCDLYFDK